MRGGACARLQRVRQSNDRRCVRKDPKRRRPAQDFQSTRGGFALMMLRGSASLEWHSRWRETRYEATHLRWRAGVKGWKRMGSTSRNRAEEGVVRRKCRSHTDTRQAEAFVVSIDRRSRGRAGGPHLHAACFISRYALSPDLRCVWWQGGCCTLSGGSLGIGGPSSQKKYQVLFIIHLVLKT
jgi:hypothetical protein